jgi:hypothetical protein
MTPHDVLNVQPYDLQNDIDKCEKCPNHNHEVETEINNVQPVVDNNVESENKSLETPAPANLSEKPMLHYQFNSQHDRIKMYLRVMISLQLFTFVILFLLFLIHIRKL